MLHIDDMPTPAQVQRHVSNLTHPDQGIQEWKAGIALRSLHELVDELRDAVQCLRGSDGYRAKISQFGEYTVGEWMEQRLLRPMLMADRVCGAAQTPTTTGSPE